MKTTAKEERKTCRAREWARRYEKPLLQVPSSASCSSDSSSSSSGSDKEGEHKESEHKQPPIIASPAQVHQTLSWAMLKSSGKIHVRVDLGENWSPLCRLGKTYDVQATDAQGETLCTAADNLVGKGTWCKKCRKFAEATISHEGTT